MMPSPLTITIVVWLLVVGVCCAVGVIAHAQGIVDERRRQRRRIRQVIAKWEQERTLGDQLAPSMGLLLRYDLLGREWEKD